MALRAGHRSSDCAPPRESFFWRLLICPAIDPSKAAVTWGQVRACPTPNPPILTTLTWTWKVKDVSIEPLIH